MSYHDYLDYVPPREVTPDPEFQPDSDSDYGYDEPPRKLLMQKEIDECKLKGHVWDDEVEPGCMRCACSKTPETMMEFQENKVVRRHIHHNPNEYQRIKLRLIKGWDLGCIARVDPDEMIEGLLKCVTWGDVHTLCDWHCCQDEWLAVPAILGWDLHLGWLFSQAIHLVYNLKHKIGLMYVVRKLADVNHWEEATKIPVKMSLETLVKSEGMWRDVCREVGLPYKRLTLDDIKVPWISDPELCQWRYAG